MKNKLVLGLTCLAVASVLASCGGSPDVDPKTLEQARDFAIAMQKGASDFNDLVYESSFKEKYSVAYESETDQDATSYSLSYHAEGDVLAGYALNVNDREEVTPAKIFNQGVGYFAGKQQETAKLSHVVTNKGDQNKTKNTQADYALSHTFGVQFDGNEFYAYGKNALTNKLVAANSSSGEFRGKIAKNSLRAFGESIVELTISRILYLEAWSSISLFKEATIEYFKGLDLSTDDKAKQFINDKQVKVTETEESLQVNFVLDGNAVIRELTGGDIGLSASLPGTAQINKTSKLVTYCDYNFKDLFLALLQKGNVDKTSYQVSVDACSLTTVLTPYSASTKKLGGTFVEYADSQKAEFMNQFNDYVVPSLDNVEIDG